MPLIILIKYKRSQIVMGLRFTAIDLLVNACILYTYSFYNYNFDKMSAPVINILNKASGIIFFQPKFIS